MMTVLSPDLVEERGDQLYVHAILRAREPTPGPGMFIRRTRGNRPVMLVHDEDGRVFAYAIKKQSTGFHGYGIQLHLGAGHALRRP